MPRYIDGSGEDQKYFDQVQRATAGQVNRDAGLMSPRDAAGALFNAGVTGAATAAQASSDNYRAFELIEYSPEPIPLISTQFIFNRTNTPDVVANPTLYRGYAESLFGSGVTLAGEVNAGVSFKPPPPLPILPYTNSVGINATNSLYDGRSRLTATYPILLYDSQVGVQSSSDYPNGIGFRIRVTNSRIWDVTIAYYADTGAFIYRPIIVATNFALNSGTLYDGVLTCNRADQNLPSLNIDVFLNMKKATIVQPAGFSAVPVGVPVFDGSDLAQTPQLIWDAL